MFESQSQHSIYLVEEMISRILYVHHGYGLGGAPKSLSMLVSGLDKKKFEAIVALPDSKGNDPVKTMLSAAGAVKVIQDSRIKPFHGSTVAPNHSLKGRVRAILLQNRLAHVSRELVDEFRPDLVHLNSTCLVAAARGARSVDDSIPVIAHVREPLLQNWWGRWLARKNRKQIDHFIAIDRAGVESMGPRPIKNCDVIYNFVDRSVYRSDPKRASEKRKSLGFREDQVVFLYLSRVAPSNGALELVRQVERLQERLPRSAVFLIAGFHEPRSEYAQQVTHVISRSSMCSELAFDPDPVALIDAVDVVIAPFTEPHSARSVFEGAAMGKPSVVTNLPHLNELVVDGETGFSYDTLTDASFLNAVNNLCDERQRLALGRGAFEFAKQRFDMTNNVARTASVYEKLLR